MLDGEKHLEKEKQREMSRERLKGKSRKRQKQRKKSYALGTCIHRTGATHTPRHL